MKYFLFLCFFSVTLACQQESTVKTSPANFVVEEDCDEKAKQKVEIKEETITLSGNTGCTLED